MTDTDPNLSPGLGPSPASIAAASTAPAADDSSATPVPPVSGTRSLVTQAPATGRPLPTPSQPPPSDRSDSTLPRWSVPLLGAALALAAVNPVKLGARGLIGWTAMLAVAAAAFWAAPAVAQRPTLATIRWTSRLLRHRNTVFAVGCVVLAAFSDPAIWLMAVDAALLPAYLLTVDALTSGPIGVRQLQRGVAPLAAVAASAVVLLGAQAPVNTGAIWGRIVAALAVAAAAAAAGSALWLRQHRPRDADQNRVLSLRQLRRRGRPRHL